jgi:hypothetical protein
MNTAVHNSTVWYVDHHEYMLPLPNKHSRITVGTLGSLGSLGTPTVGR